MEVILIAAITLDGFIARAEHQVSTAWTSKEDAKWFSQKTKEIGLCIMGRTTYETIGRPLPGRQIIVISKSGSSIESFTVGTPDTVITTHSSPKEIIEFLQLKRQQAVAICGGSSIYSQFLQAGLVNRLYLTIEPVLFGEGIGLLNQSTDIRLKQISENALTEHTFVREYEVESL